MAIANILAMIFIGYLLIKAIKNNHELFGIVAMSFLWLLNAFMVVIQIAV